MYRVNPIIDLVIIRCRLIRESRKVSVLALCNDKSNVVKDHFTVYCTLNMGRRVKTKKAITFRAIRLLHHAALSHVTAI